MRLNRLIRGRLLRTVPRFAALDWVREHHEGGEMFEGMEIGQVIVVQCIDFPYVGRVVACTDSRVTLADAVKVIWDGRHGEFTQGRPPQSAEVEKTWPIFHVNVDSVIGWGPYPGNRIPAPQ